MTADRGIGGASSAGLGTVYLSDSRLLPLTITTNYNGIYYGFTNWVVSSLTISSNSWMSVAQGAVNLTASNDLVIAGRLELTNVTVNCLGNLVLTNGGSFYVYSGMTNGSPVTNYGALVSVAQGLVINSNCWLYPFSHATNGGSCLFQMSNLTIRAGGGINANSRGYAGGPDSGTTHNGFGPGRGGNTSGGGYGGQGGNGGGGTYGSTNVPTQPGSGGGDYTGAGGPGGGLVWLLVTNAVTMEGLITANGGTQNGASGGSGGGIYIACNTVQGSNGVFTANGGNTTGYGGGGGGRIAISYGTVAQSLMPQASLTFGAYGGASGGAYAPGQAGTIWLPDAQLLSPYLTTNSTGRYYGLTNWGTASLTVSNATVVFGETNITLWVTNDLALYGAAGSLTFKNSTLHVGGSLTLTNSATLTFAGALSSGLSPHYALDVDGIGTVVIASNSTITVTGATTNDASVHFRALDFTLAAGAALTNSAGFAGGVGTNGYGPGGGLTTIGGGGYGGRGGDATKGGPVYGSATAPDMPGSGGGASGTGGRGGGYVRVDVSNTVTLAGTINVNGGNAPSGIGGGGSGGGIYISADTLMPAAGILTANGGNGISTGYGGGGGRIALAYRVNNYSGATNVLAGGTTSLTGFPGTVTLQLSASMLDLNVQGSPASHGTPAPYNYGDNGVLAGTVVTNTVDSPNGAVTGQQFVCLGWTALTNGSVLTTGATTQAIFTMITNTVQTWIWTNQYYLAASTGPSGALQTAVTGWYTNGNVVTMMAVPTNGYQFSQWVGDLPAGTYTNNPLTITMNQARTIAGYFAPQTPISIVWNGTGNWFSATNWTPVGVPGTQDTARINSGIVTLSKDPTTVGALTVGGVFVVQSNSTLTVMQDITITGATARLVITNSTLAGQGNLTLSGGGSLYTYATGTNPAALVSTTYQVRVDIAGNVNVGSNCWIYPYSDWTNGGVARFTMANLTITAPNSGFDASSKGFRGGINTPVTGAGPGWGANRGGGGYGGMGGGIGGGITYGLSNFPAMPGSGGGSYYNNGGWGGGCVWIESKGKVDVGGTLNADGGSGLPSGSGGSGGSIYVRCERLNGAGSLSANGGPGSDGGGGGGRIALYRSRDGFTGTISYTNGVGGLGNGQPGTLVEVLLPEGGSSYIIR